VHQEGLTPVSFFPPSRPRHGIVGYDSAVVHGGIVSDGVDGVDRDTTVDDEVYSAGDIGSPSSTVCASWSAVLERGLDGVNG
jgi:hypothetical protein